MTGVSFDQAMGRAFRSAMVAALVNPAALAALTPLAEAATVEGLLEIGVATADLLLCWTLHGVAVPAGVIARARAALAAPRPAGLRAEADARATREVLARLDGVATDLPPLRPPAGLGWEALASWAVDAAPLAAPGLDAGVLVGRELDLLRGLALAIQQEQWERAASLSRWLSLYPADPAWAEDLELGRNRIAYQMHCGLHQQTDANRAAMVATAVQITPAMIVARRARPPGAAVAAVGAGAAVAVTAPAGDGHGPAADVRQALTDRTLAWLDANLERFAVPAGNGQPAFVGVKAIGDLSLGAWLASTSGDPRLAARGRAAADHGWAQLGEGRRLVELIEHDPRLTAFVTIYSFFHRMGYRHAPLDDALRQHAGAASPEIAALMDCNLALVGIETPAHLAEIAARAPYGKLKPPWLMSRDDSYHLTHVVFALADFGRRPLSAGKAHVERWLPVWTRWCELTGDHDLLAEMIMTWHCALPTCPPASAWAMLAAAQRADGSIPFSAKTSARRYADYHTTVVALAALAMCRHPPAG